MAFRVLAVAGLVLCLSGCDRPERTAVIAPAPPCHCTPVPQAAPAPKARHLSWHSRHYVVRYARDTDHESQSTVSETSSYSESDDDQSAAEPQAPPPSGHAWVDGYGMSHVEPVDPALTVAAAPPDTSDRRDPWHGYHDR